MNLAGTGIDLHSDDTMLAEINYNGTTLTLDLTDRVTLTRWSHAFTVNIPAAVGGNTAYVGFTAVTGAATANQEILSWTYAAGNPGAPTPPLPSRLCHRIRKASAE